MRRFFEWFVGFKWFEAHHIVFYYVETGKKIFFLRFQTSLICIDLKNRLIPSSGALKSVPLLFHSGITLLETLLVIFETLLCSSPFSTPPLSRCLPIHIHRSDLTSVTLIHGILSKTAPVSFCWWFSWIWGRKAVAGWVDWAPHPSNRCPPFL